MRTIWMGVIPDRNSTRILVLDGPGQPILKARLPQSPQHPRAIQALAEALALWFNRPVHAAIAADGPEPFCDTTPWQNVLDSITNGPLCEIQIVARARPPRERDGLGGLGDFKDVRQLLLFEVAR